jgi:uncharacterized SAM-binding protein YcdF (DUF218 family)
MIAAALAWAGGFVWFMRRIDQPVPLPPQTDGIVALTGGAGPVDAALRLLAASARSRLLITGIGGGSDLATLAARAGIDPAPLADRVTLGREALSTRGNAIEALGWAEAHDIRSLTVVTAPFRMPRALAELHRMLPGVALYPFPVAGPDGGRGGDAARWRVSLRVLIGEYNKYLVVAAGLSDLMPGRDAPRWGHASG